MKPMAKPTTGRNMPGLRALDAMPHTPAARPKTLLRSIAALRMTPPVETSKLIWRGVLYGIVDTLLLTVFPCLVAYGLWHHDLAGVGRKLGYGLTAVLLVLSVTATYHLGYRQYRSPALVSPEIGNVLYSVPTLLTLNPVGSLVWHASVHVAAVTHQYEGSTFTPPQRVSR
jgi:hypothetical protein